jgi:hypothetical protein
LPAEDFEQRLSSHFEKAGSSLSRPSIQVPFLRQDRPDLPPDLVDALTEAMQVNVRVLL